VNSVTVFKTRAQDSVTAPVLVLAHGAGAPADSPFMELLAAALSAQGVTTVRFEFPYMEKRREDGKKRPPDRQPTLLGHFRRVIADTCAGADGQAGVFVGGKSMGGEWPAFWRRSLVLMTRFVVPCVLAIPFTLLAKMTGGGRIISSRCAGQYRSFRGHGTLLENKQKLRRVTSTCWTT